MKPGRRGENFFLLLCDSLFKLVRSSTRDVGTLTDVLPKKPIRPLSISGNEKYYHILFQDFFLFQIETQVLDRYEKNEKIRRDSITG